MTAPLETAPRLTAQQLASARENAHRALLSARVAAGHWEGRLSSSALSTATAVAALTLFDRVAVNSSDAAARRQLIGRGIEWLCQTQNADGGWGDTTLSLSNISTTALCWAALGMHHQFADANLQRAEQWLTIAVGSLDSRDLAAAIARRYGRDRTFSVPILTMCTLAGRFGADRSAWKLVPQLPFELAALPQAWFRWLRLPVVSYALPALIAIGQVRHHRGPTWNPLTWAIRQTARRRTLAVLERIQPAGGGFLEATPLTSFVTMSLIGAGLAQHVVVREGLDFLVRAARPDGSWPIDTNLATWVTTLSVNALSIGGQSFGAAQPASLTTEDRKKLLRWLLDQQYRTVHPYTAAAPGGWAWTDLPGGVPDADDTPGAMIALAHLGPEQPECLTAARAGAIWLLDLQNRDGGMPTFCRGWGALPFDRSGADLTAHALHAWELWRERFEPALQTRIAAAMGKALRYLARTQTTAGAWSPLWFGNQHAVDEENLVYGASRVLAALSHLNATQYPIIGELSRRAIGWLVSMQQPDGLWGGTPQISGSLEETSLALVALCGIPRPMKSPEVVAAIMRGICAVVSRTKEGREFPPAPIGFYFAKLWYYEELYPLIWTVAALQATQSMPGLDDLDYGQSCADCSSSE